MIVTLQLMRQQKDSIMKLQNLSKTVLGVVAAAALLGATSMNAMADTNSQATNQNQSTAVSDSGTVHHAPIKFNYEPQS